MKKNGGNSKRVTDATQKIGGVIVTTWKIERLYSPVVLAAVAIGRKPAAVTIVPDSMGNAVVT